MGKSLLLLAAGFLFYANDFCVAQTKSQISDPVVELKGNLIYISFDIPGSTSSERYDVRIEITDSNGNLVNARALEGDIGENILGGGEKTIVWKFGEDRADLSDEISFQLYATKESDKEEIQDMEDIPSMSYNKVGLIAKSLALPGLGLTRMTNGKPHWIKGITGYGCIAGSIIFNRKAINTFDHYLSPSSDEFAMDLYDASKRQDNISEILAYSAVGIWVTDIMWTLISASRLDKTNYNGNTGGFSVGTGFASTSGAPLLCFRYLF